MQTFASASFFYGFSWIEKCIDKILEINCLQACFQKQIFCIAFS